MSDIIICDEYVAEMASNLNCEIEKIEEVLSTYIRLLRGIRENGFMQGKTAEALEEFINQASTIKGQFREIGQSLDVTCNAYIEKINEADEYLY